MARYNELLNIEQAWKEKDKQIVQLNYTYRQGGGLGNNLVIINESEATKLLTTELESLKESIRKIRFTKIPRWSTGKIVWEIL